MLSLIYPLIPTQNSLRSSPWPLLWIAKRPAVTTTEPHQAVAAFQQEVVHSAVVADRPSAAEVDINKKLSDKIHKKAWPSTRSCWIKSVKFCCAKKVNHQTVADHQTAAVNPAHNTALHSHNTVHLSSSNRASLESSWRTQSHPSRSLNTVLNHSQPADPQEDSAVIHRDHQASEQSPHKLMHQAPTTELLQAPAMEHQLVIKQSKLITTKTWCIQNKRH